MIDLNDLQTRVHQNAVAKGWWDSGDRPWREVRILIVSEVAEALEEYRAGRMSVWHAEPRPDSRASFVKPEGFPIELADAAIRLLDYAGRCGFEWDEDDVTYIIDGNAEGVPEGIPDQLDRLAEHLYCNDHEQFGTIWQALSSCFDVALRNGIDLLAAIELKHAYNVTRPYRHGGKRA